MSGLSLQVSIGLGLLIAVALWCQLHLCSLFQSIRRFDADGQRKREAEFLARTVRDFPDAAARVGGAGCPWCGVGMEVALPGDPCPHCTEPMLPADEAYRKWEGVQEMCP